MAEGNRTAARAGRQAAALFALTGLLTLIGLGIPGAGGTVAILSITTVALVIALLAARLPWWRWSTNATLWLVPVAFLLIAGAAGAGIIPTRAYGIAFVLAFAWIGLNHRPGTSFWLVPLATAAYVVPIVVFDLRPDLDPRAVVMAMATCVLVAETIARGQAEARSSAERAHRAVVALRALTRASAAMTKVDTDTVLAAVADSALSLGYDGANLAILEPGSATFSPTHTRGLADALAGQEFPADAGLTARVVAKRTVVVARDYGTVEGALPAITAAGIRSVVAVPIFAGEELVGVLSVCTATPFDPTDQDLDALAALAEVAGAALRHGHQVDAAELAAEAEALAARTDALTGVANRREGDRLLRAIHPGDVIAVVDIDEFSSVNSRLGHAGGDRALTALADHLRRQVRNGDTVVRYGGDEFLLILPRCELGEAAAVLDRLQSSWTLGDHGVTFSVGFARHVAGRSPASSLHAADEALYGAKDGGRDRVQQADLLDV